MTSHPLWLIDYQEDQSGALEESVSPVQCTQLVDSGTERAGLEPKGMLHRRKFRQFDASVLQDCGIT